MEFQKRLVLPLALQLESLPERPRNCFVLAIDTLPRKLSLIVQENWQAGSEISSDRLLHTLCCTLRLVLERAKSPGLIANQ